MRTKTNMRRVAGLRLTAATPGEALHFISEAAQARRAVSVHLVNAYSAVLASQNARYAAALDDEQAILLPDGTPLIWLSRLSRGFPLTGVRGPTLMRKALLDGGVSGRRHFLLGSTRENLDLLTRTLAERGREDLLCGTYSPPFGPLEENEWRRIVGEVRTAEAELVWVGLGTPLQDFFAVRLAREGFTAVAVGAAFDFLAGTKKEAPGWLHGSGFEWLYRLVTEPRRLWRRYLIGNVQFLRLAATDALRQRRD